jgi:serine/threonine protein kinase/Tol biopolymer transport system component
LDGGVEEMSLAGGTKLGPYEIQSPLGAGGMGEVYRARDTRLGRDVAIKILPKEMSADPVRKQRFEREARTISGLNHPHICVLYDVGQQNGVDFLVMECIEGETLAKRLEKGPLPLEQALKYGAQIADALDKAHRSGVVHRDLKPGNIMVTATGVKLLDFGLAKPAALPADAATFTAASPSFPVTEEGTIVGTFQYMSPEQVEGKELDGRSDIFSLGAVLYEMLTGQRAFKGKSQLSVASAILEREPTPISSIKPMTPPALDHAIRRCLAKDPEQRWQTGRDLQGELLWISESAPSAATPWMLNGKKKKRELLAWILVSVLALSTIAAVTMWRRSPQPPQTTYFFAPLNMTAQDIALAGDGRTAAVVAFLESARKNVIWIYEVGSQSARILPETEGAEYPFWSPDGKSIGFFADGRMKKLDLASGQVRTICDAPAGRGGTWNKDDVILFAPHARQGGLYRVSASGGTPQPVTKTSVARKETSHRWPVFLPDGNHFLFMAATFSGIKNVDAIFVGSLESEETKFILEADANAAYAAPGYLLYYRDKTLLAQRFDIKNFALRGQASDLFPQVRFVRQVKRVVFAVSNDGVLLAQGGGTTALADSEPKWFDRSGKELGTLDKPGVYGNVAIAANGRSVAVDNIDPASLNMDVWTYDTWQNATPRRLTFDPGYDGAAVWSPDGSQVLFSSNRQMNLDLYLKNADGAREERDVNHDETDKLSSDWSRDGKYILYRRADDLWYMTLPESTSKRFLKSSGTLRNGQFSPDGKWVAYNSNETGKWEIYVTSFPEPLGKWQISTNGGEQPRWRGDGKELFYLSSDGHVMAVSVTTGAHFSSATPVALFQANPRQPVSYLDIFAYDVTREGQRFLINTDVKAAETVPMSVVLNWPGKLSK